MKDLLSLRRFEINPKTPSPARALLFGGMLLFVPQGGFGVPVTFIKFL